MSAVFRASALALLVVASFAACMRGEGGAGSRGEATPPESSLVVFAAASLREAFTGLGDAFEASHPGVEVKLQLAGSQELRTHIEHGAAADVFASADLAHMNALRERGLVRAPTIFAQNELVIVVAREASASAASIRRLADLGAAERLVVGAPTVPIGRYTLAVLDNAERALGPAFRADLERKVVSRELNVRQVLAKVVLGEADAGVVYRTDARAAELTVRVVDIDAGFNVVADYPVALVEGAPSPGLAQAFVELLTSAAGTRALEAAGFRAGAGASAPFAVTSTPTGTP